MQRHTQIVVLGQMSHTKSVLCYTAMGHLKVLVCEGDELHPVEEPDAMFTLPDVIPNLPHHRNVRPGHFCCRQAGGAEETIDATGVSRGQELAKRIGTQVQLRTGYI